MNYNYVFLLIFLFSPHAYSEVVIEPKSTDCEQNSTYRQNNACEPIVMVVRHAEDGFENGVHFLTDSGKKHAELYVQLFKDYIFSNSHGFGTGGPEVCVCPIGKIITIAKISNVINRNPSSNPYNTIEPLAKNLNLEIQTVSLEGIPYSSGFQWNPEKVRLSLISSNTSTVIAWDKQGLNATKEDYTKLQNFIPSLQQIPYDQFLPLLKALPTQAIAESISFVPSRDHFYVFDKQDSVTGKFSVFKLYNQQFSKDGVIWYSAPNDFLTDLPSYIRVK